MIFRIWFSISYLTKWFLYKNAFWTWQSKKKIGWQSFSLFWYPIASIFVNDTTLSSINVDFRFIWLSRHVLLLYPVLSVHYSTLSRKRGSRSSQWVFKIFHGFKVLFLNNNKVKIRWKDDFKPSYSTVLGQSIFVKVETLIIIIIIRRRRRTFIHAHTIKIKIQI